MPQSEDKHINDLKASIKALREKTKALLEQNNVAEMQALQINYQKVVDENHLLKKQFEELEKHYKTEYSAENNLQKENELLKKQLKELKTSYKETKNIKPIEVLETKVIQENKLLKKELEQKEKNIKELVYKVEMFKLAKNLKTDDEKLSKNEELKHKINEYIKEIDKNILLLNS